MSAFYRAFRAGHVSEADDVQVFKADSPAQVLRALWVARGVLDPKHFTPEKAGTLWRVEEIKPEDLTVCKYCGDGAHNGDEGQRADCLRAEAAEVERIIAARRARWGY